MLEQWIWDLGLQISLSKVSPHNIYHLLLKGFAPTLIYHLQYSNFEIDFHFSQVLDTSPSAVFLEHFKGTPMYNLWLCPGDGGSIETLSHMHTLFPI